MKPGRQPPVSPPLVFSAISRAWPLYLRTTSHTCSRKTLQASIQFGRILDRVLSGGCSVDSIGMGSIPWSGPRMWDTNFRGSDKVLQWGKTSSQNTAEEYQ